MKPWVSNLYQNQILFPYSIPRLWDVKLPTMINPLLLKRCCFYERWKWQKKIKRHLTIHQPQTWLCMKITMGQSVQHFTWSDFKCLFRKYILLSVSQSTSLIFVHTFTILKFLQCFLLKFILCSITATFSPFDSLCSTSKPLQTSLQSFHGCENRLQVIPMRVNTMWVRGA